MKCLSQCLLLGALLLLPVKGVRAETPEGPIYIKTSNGWNGAYAHGNEYAEFRVIGNGAKLQDPLSYPATKERWNDGFLCR
jgi:hypothetical protein